MRKPIALSVVSALAVVGLFAASAPASADADGDFFTNAVHLDGAQEAPGPGDADGRGTFVIVAFDDRLCYALNARHIDPAFAAHIHRAPVGVPGPIVIGLIAPTENASADCIEAVPDDTAGNPNSLLTESELAEILGNPEMFYVNVHNAAFPAGAIRAQLA